MFKIEREHQKKTVTLTNTLQNLQIEKVIKLTAYLEMLVTVYIRKFIFYVRFFVHSSSQLCSGRAYTYYCLSVSYAMS